MFCCLTFYLLQASETKQNILHQQESCVAVITLTGVQEERHKKEDFQEGCIFRCLSLYKCGLPVFSPLFPWRCVLLEWQLLDSLRPLSSLFSPYYLCPVGGQAVVAKCGAAQQGWSPDTADSYFPPDAQDRENRELAITRLLSIYILQSWPALLGCTPL